MHLPYVNTAAGKMYLPYVKVTAQEDRIGNLLLWLGHKPKPDNDNLIAYVQTSQARGDLLANCLVDDEEVAELSKGYKVEMHLHCDTAVELFCYDDHNYANHEVTE